MKRCANKRIGPLAVLAGLILLSTPTLAESRLPVGNLDFSTRDLAHASTTQSVTIESNYSSLSDPANDVSEDVSELKLHLPDGYWQLELRSHTLLGDKGILQRAIHDIPQFHQGIVTGDRSSWARISQTTVNGIQVFGGFIERSGQLYRLHHASGVGTRGQASAGEITHQLTQLGNSEQLFPDELLQRHEDEWQPRATISQAVTRAARIGVAIDSRFDDYHGGRGLAQALTIINGVDGLYRSQLGLALIVDSIRVYDDPTTDPLRAQSGDVEDLLTEFRSVRLSDPELPTSLALVHLFSGHQNAMQVIGLGWIDTACRNDGYDLSMSTPFPFDMLLTAHEIAHNLGALHDDDTECQITGNAFAGNVMWSQLSSASRAEFSSCSLQRILPTLEKGCFAENIDVNVSLFASRISSPLERRIEIQTSNPDLTRTADGIRTETMFPENTLLSEPSAGCTIVDTQLYCSHRPLPAGGQDIVSVHASLAGFDDQQVVTRLVTSNFEDANEADNRAALNVLQMASSAIGGVPSDDATTDGNTATGSSAGIGGSGLWLISALGLVILSTRISAKSHAGSSTLQHKRVPHRQDCVQGVQAFCDHLWSNQVIAGQWVPGTIQYRWLRGNCFQIERDKASQSLLYSIDENHVYCRRLNEYSAIHSSASR